MCMWLLWSAIHSVVGSHKCLVETDYYYIYRQPELLLLRGWDQEVGVNHPLELHLQELGLALHQCGLPHHHLFDSLHLTNEAVQGRVQLQRVSICV